MQNLMASHPATNYLSVLLRARIAAVKSAAEGEDRQLGASAVEWVVITMISLVIIGVAGYAIYGAISTKSTAISNCIGSSNGTTSSCAP
jgi:Flp pilus assembly pilin Flp